ncbi:DUF4244 domain-containing protein [Paludifilum halophilum]|uniref:Bacterial CdiA-CT RNAse A domain-containing protein n=1 Tax=Paludifilum halophilum TaxID=1642702 RepID=A0A235B385_9BACL|nr:DUF4244 domain-containing protein [Paludifilum halophilum]OYD06085.1 hypothetical protein CHM34_18195 [Paludifilum halophilum]
MAVREKSHRGGADVRENPSWWNKKGASTLEYVVILAAAALLAGILYSTLTSDSVAGILKQKIEQAINGEGSGEGNETADGEPPDSGSPDEPSNEQENEPPSQSPPPSKEKPPPQEEKSGWETAGDVVAELSGYNDAKAAITGVDENGNKIGVGERLLRGALALPTPAGKVAKGGKYVAQYGDDALALGKKAKGKLDDALSKGKKKACACPKKLAPGGGLKAHESKGGHLLSRHVNVNDQDLIKRVKSNKKITRASRFKDEATAERVAHDAIMDLKNQHKIKKWLNNPSREKVSINYNGKKGEVLGRGFEKGSNKVQDMKERAVIVLKKDGKGGYFILTGYPNKY